ncbi:MAG: NADH-quinone oxidoreductase subunit C [Anaerolineaceae bacterium]|nr:NADH-quinone oxidoreductase subunit C [Anaerolineaceae bacterium]
MNTQTALTQAKQLLQEWIIQEEHPETNRLDVWISVETFHPAATSLVEHNWGYLSAITGIDRPAPTTEEAAPALENQIEVMYHFAEGAAITTLHILLPYTNLAIDTICDLIPSASMYERELMEMLGVICVGTPTREKLVLPDEWPDGVYPLRKSFTGLGQVKFEEYE